MGEKMARERIEKETVPVSEIWRDALQRADRVLKQWPRSAKVAASIGLIAFVSTASQAKEGVIEPSVIQPAEGKETTLEISAAQIPVPDVGVPTGSSAPEYVERLPVEVEEKVPLQEVSPKAEAIISLNLNYTIRPYDTLSEIAQRFGTTQDEILTLNPGIKDQNLIHPGEELIIPEVSVEQTVEFLQDLQKKVDKIYGLRQNWIGRYIVQEGDNLWNIAQKHETSVERLLYLNSDIEDPDTIFPGQELTVTKAIVPSPFLGEIFQRLESDQQRLQNLIDSGQSGDLEAKMAAMEIIEYWNAAPGEGEDVPEPEIVVEPKAERGDWIKSQLEEMISLIPNFGRIVWRIEIKPTGEWGHPEGTYSYKDKGATIHIYDKGWFGRPWVKDSLLDKFAHGALGHAASIYSEGYNLRFLTPAEIIELVNEDTIIWDEMNEISLLEGHRRKIDEEEGNASQVQYSLYQDQGIIGDGELAQRRLDYFAKLYSKTFGVKITIPELGRKLGIRKD